MVLCVLDGKCAEKWQTGVEIKNAEVRRELAKYPFGETEESTKYLYKFYSSGTHTNRDFIPRRFLGEGNQFVLGSIPKPSIALVTDYCTNHLRMWFWFTAILLYFFRDVDHLSQPEFGKRYLHVAEVAQHLIKEF